MASLHHYIRQRWDSAARSPVTLQCDGSSCPSFGDAPRRRPRPMLWFVIQSGARNLLFAARATGCPRASLLQCIHPRGPVAQLGERIVRNDEVGSSILPRSTIFSIASAGHLRLGFSFHESHLGRTRSALAGTPCKRKNVIMGHQFVRPRLEQIQSDERREQKEVGADPVAKHDREGDESAGGWSVIRDG